MDKNLSSRRSLFLSIVIPVYNVEKYLIRCLDSILNQKVNFNYEIIAVNDCSTDSSLSILNDYKQKFDNITIVDHSRNKKLSVARKSGIELSRGNYIMHIDSDDWILENSLQNLHRILSVSQSDVIVFNYYTEDSRQNRVLSHLIDNDQFYINRENCHKYFLGAPWNKVVKRELLINTIYGSVGINNGEDLVYSSELFLKATTISLCSYSFYIYFDNSNSLTKVSNNFSFLSNQQLVIQELSKVLLKYKANQEVINFITNYFLDFIYHEIFKFNFKNKYRNDSLVLESLNNIISNVLFSVLERKALHRSLNSKYYSFLQVRRRFGLKKTIGILLIK